VEWGVLLLSILSEIVVEMAVLVFFLLAELCLLFKKTFITLKHFEIKFFQLLHYQIMKQGICFVWKWERFESNTRQQ